MSGVELAAQLQQSPYREIPMLAISASPLMLELAKSSHLFVDTVAKPFDVRTFLDAVDRSARSRGHLGARDHEQVGAAD